MTLTKHVHSEVVMARHTTREQMIRTGQANLQQAWRAQQFILEAAVAAGVDLDAPMKLALLNNDIAKGDFKQTQEIPIEMTDSEKTQYSNEWKPTGNGMPNSRKIKNKRSCSFLGSVPNCYKTKWSKTLIGPQ